MRATVKQLESLNNLEKDYALISVGEYGFYSDNTIGVICKDSFGEFNVKISVDGRIYSKQY